jgi:hypothetical protein
MAGNLSNYGEIKLLDHILGVTNYSIPSATHIGLYTVAPSDASGGTEVLGSGYTRQLATWSDATSSGSANSNTITFTASGGAWGVVVALGLFDSASAGAGNLLWYGPLTVPRNMNARSGQAYVER